jgi:HSP20 family protein
MARALTRRRWGADITPWRELDLLSDRMRRLIGPPLGEELLMGPLWADTEEWIPAVELVEEDGEYVLTAELPGISKSDIDVSVADSTLTLKGEKKSEKEDTKGRTQFRERRYGAFERSFTLPGNVDASKIKAEFENGVVKVHLPKGPEAMARHIELR